MSANETDRKDTSRIPSPAGDGAHALQPDRMASLALVREGDTLRVTLSGSWSLEGVQPAKSMQKAFSRLGEEGLACVEICAQDLGEWDSSLLAFVVDMRRAAGARGLACELLLPESMQDLLRLAFAVKSREGSEKEKRKLGFLEGLGAKTLEFPARFSDVLEFVGDIALSLGRLFRGKSAMRSKDFFAAMYECSVGSLAIVAITNLLFGLILAFVGSVQLVSFGAQIYVAGLVGIGMLRVLGAVMVGVVMSGRVGAAYAALIGTMQVNEEVDALTTLGISPIDFLVLPRMLALMLMVPLLTVYADLMGILGGYVVGVSMLGLSSAEYLNATMQMVSFVHGLIGIAYGTVFGIIIALAGCYQGIRCGRSAQAVGLATTTAVVQSIVGIIIATAVITIICNVLGI